MRTRRNPLTVQIGRWTPLDEGKVSEVLEGGTAQGKSRTEDEFEDDDMHMDEGEFEDRVRARGEDF